MTGTIVRIFNRAAQRYLLQRGDAAPMVGVPGPNVRGEAAWDISNEAKGTVDLVAAADGRRMVPAGGSVAYVGDAERTGRGHWLLEPADDDYHYLVSVDSPDRVLAARSTNERDWALELRPERNRWAMWLLQDHCVKDARSVHLRYGVDNPMALFYNEVYVEEAPPGTFFCMSGFGANARGAAPSGYAGIQRRPDGATRAIFSVWHRMADEVIPVPGASAMTVGAHPAAETTLFSGEGSGSSIRLPMDWQERATDPIRLALTAERLGDDTAIAAYVSQDTDSWIHLGVIVREQTGGQLMGRPYSFIEDFLRNGNIDGVDAADRSPYRTRSAQFANPWAGTSRSSPTPITDATLTVYSPHPLESVAAELTGFDRFGIAVATGNAEASQAPPIGARFTDRYASGRSALRLDGIPPV